MKSFVLLFLFIAVISFKSNAQDYLEVKPEIQKEGTLIPDQYPMYPGGQAELEKHMLMSLKYPAAAKNKGVEGLVLISYAVDVDGSIVDIEIIQSPHKSLSKEAIKIIKSMNQWKPAVLDEKPIKIQFFQAFRFKDSTKG